MAASYVVQSLKYRRAREDDMVWMDYRAYETESEAVEDFAILCQNVPTAGPFRVVRREDEVLKQS